MKYKALISSDWNECLAPCGPFDPVSFTFPDLEPELKSLFRQYTGNEISLAEATRRIAALTPRPTTTEDMDAYLDASFSTYRGVPELIDWCLSRDILFMINTTGTQGYFQRAFARGLLSPVPVVAANPLIRFPVVDSDPCFAFQVKEIHDKPRNTSSVIESYGIPRTRVIVVGDSGGDGPHFEWGSSLGAFLIGSMTKGSLESYCSKRGITIHERFGISYAPGEKRDVEKEMSVNFMELISHIEAFLSLPASTQEEMV